MVHARIVFHQLPHATGGKKNAQLGDSSLTIARPMGKTAQIAGNCNMYARTHTTDGTTPVSAAVECCNMTSAQMSASIYIMSASIVSKRGVVSGVDVENSPTYQATASSQVRMDWRTMQAPRAPHLQLLVAPWPPLCQKRSSSSCQNTRMSFLSSKFPRRHLDVSLFNAHTLKS